MLSLLFKIYFPLPQYFYDNRSNRHSLNFPNEIFQTIHYKISTNTVIRYYNINLENLFTS